MQEVFLPLDAPSLRSGAVASNRDGNSARTAERQNDASGECERRDAPQDEGMQREDLMRVHHRFLRIRRDLTLPNIGEAIIVVASGLLAAAPKSP